MSDTFKEYTDLKGCQAERVTLLMEGARITAGDRNKEYGAPIENMTMTGELKAVFFKHVQRPMGVAEREALEMVFTKLGRLGRGAIKRDTYLDAAVYMAIAYEVAMIETARLPKSMTAVDKYWASDEELARLGQT